MKFRKIYSLNLIAFLRYSGIKGKLDIEGGQVYGVFPDDVETRIAIKEFRNDLCMVNLHFYLKEFKEIRAEISILRGGNDA